MSHALRDLKFITKPLAKFGFVLVRLICLRAQASFHFLRAHLLPLVSFTSLSLRETANAAPKFPGGMQNELCTHHTTKQLLSREEGKRK